MLYLKEMHERQLGRGRATRLVSFNNAIRLIRTFPGRTSDDTRDKFVAHIRRLILGDVSSIVVTDKPFPSSSSLRGGKGGADSESESSDDDSVVPETPKSQQGGGEAPKSQQGDGGFPARDDGIIPARRSPPPSVAGGAGKGAAGRPAGADGCGAKSGPLTKMVRGGGPDYTGPIYAPENISHLVYVGKGRSIGCYLVPGVGEVVLGAELISSVASVDDAEAIEVCLIFVCIFQFIVL